MMQRRYEQCRARLLPGALTSRFRTGEHHAEELSRRLGRAAQNHLTLASRHLQAQVQQLNICSPLNTLKRGYSIVKTADGQVVRHHNEAPAGTGVSVLLSQGRLQCRVTAAEPEEDTGVPEASGHRHTSGSGA